MEVRTTLKLCLEVFSWGEQMVKEGKGSNVIDGKYFPLFWMFKERRGTFCPGFLLSIAWFLTPSPHNFFLSPPYNLQTIIWSLSQFVAPLFFQRPQIHTQHNVCFVSIYLKNDSIVQFQIHISFFCLIFVFWSQFLAQCLVIILRVRNYI